MFETIEALFLPEKVYSGKKANIIVKLILSSQSSKSEKLFDRIGHVLATTRAHHPLTVNSYHSTRRGPSNRGGNRRFISRIEFEAENH